MFQNNRNKQKTNRNSNKFGKISTFFIPHIISSACFGCFDTGPKHRNKLKKKNWGVLRKSKPKNNQNRLRFGSNWEKKLQFWGPPNRERFWRFFRFVSTKFCLFWLIQYRSKTPKQTKKNVFWFRKTNWKTTKTSFGLFRFEPQTKFIVSRTPY